MSPIAPADKEPHRPVGHKPVDQPPPRQPDLSPDTGKLLREGLSPDTGRLLREGLEQAVPFNLHNEVRILEVGAGSGVAMIPDAAHLKNHLGTQHGGALFAVAEAAAGAAYVGAFMEHLGEIRMNAQEVHIKYMHWARGPITARSTLEQEIPELLACLHRTGRLDLTMRSTLHDADERTVSEMTFRFQLKLTDRPQGRASATGASSPASVETRMAPSPVA